MPRKGRVAEILITIGESLGNSGVNIEGLSFTTLGNQSVIHFLVNDKNSALKALGHTNLQDRELME